MAGSDAIDDILLRWEELRERGHDAPAEELCRDQPELTEEVRRRIRALDAIHRLREPGNETPTVEIVPGQEPRPSLGVEVPRVAGYEILREIGRGGMGVVYKARQIRLNRIVALKMILAGPHAGATELARFRAEAETAARLQHPNIVQVYEVGEQEGRPYLCLEFVDGVSLDEVMRGKPQPPEDAARLVRTLAEAIQYAHEHGVVHRDLKPGNVLMASGGREAPDGHSSSGASRPPLAVKITDFGLAKRLDDSSGLTRTGAVLGTPSYMAPEQAEGKGAVGPAADVYALGTILYEMLIGRPPFHAGSLFETLEQVRTQEPEPPRRHRPDLPRDLEIICLKCLRKDPDLRYPSARALAEDLDRFLQGEPIHARSVRLIEKVTRLLDRSPLLSPTGDLRPTVLLCLAPIPFLAHLGLFLVAGGQADYPLMSLVLTFSLALALAGAAWVAQPGVTASLSAALRRQLWSTRIGHALGLALVPLVSYLITPAGVAWNPLSVYPLWAVVAGVTFFNLGGAFWGRLYLIGLGLFAVAVLMSLNLEWAAVIMGLSVSTVVATLGLHLRRVTRGGTA